MIKVENNNPRPQAIKTHGGHVVVPAGASKIIAALMPDPAERDRFKGLGVTFSIPEELDVHPDAEYLAEEAATAKARAEELETKVATLQVEADKVPDLEAKVNRLTADLEEARKPAEGEPSGNKRSK